MRTAAGAKIIVTGAASGMGLLYCERAVSEGAAAISMWDRDADALHAAWLKLGSLPQVSTQLVDLSDSESVQNAYVATTATLGTPDILINNAGIVSGNDYFWDTDMATQNEPTMRVNTLAPMHVTNLFLPDMIAEAERPKRILNIASAAATVSNPRMSVYAASKWALYGWSDSLRLELKQAKHAHIRVTTFCPSYVSTGMFAGAKGMLLTPIITPERAVDKAWTAMLAGKPVQLAPNAVNLGKILRGVLPVSLWDKVAQMMGVYSSMSKFTGRT